MFDSFGEYLNGRSVDVMDTVDILNAMDELIDEVLLPFVVEVCVRRDKPELLTHKFRKLEEEMDLIFFGRLITIRSLVSAIDGVWRCWKEMQLSAMETQKGPVN